MSKEQNKNNEIDAHSMSNESLFHQCFVFGNHEAGVIVCDRAINGDEEALEFAVKIWKFLDLN